MHASAVVLGATIGCARRRVNHPCPRLPKETPCTRCSRCYISADDDGMGHGALSEAVARLSLTDQTTVGIREVLAGRRHGWRSRLLFAGPAVIASIAYMDPGNFATNIQAGAGFGYSLLWVALLANLIAMLFQALSAKLGIVTGRNLAELCREQFPRGAVYAMWGASEVAAMATDLAEFLGGAIGLSLLFGIPLLCGHGGHRHRDLRHPAVPDTRLPADRTDHRRARCSDRAVLSGRDVRRPRGVGRSGVARGAAIHAERRGADAVRRHRRRNGDAARDLPAFGADAGSGAAAQHP